MAAWFSSPSEHHKAPTNPAFLALANEACGLTAPGAMTGTPGGTGTGGGMSSPYAGLLKQRDLNGDGKLGSDEVAAALLQRLDSNQDGFVNEEELKALGKK